MSAGLATSLKNEMLVVGGEEKVSFKKKKEEKKFGWQRWR